MFLIFYSEYVRKGRPSSYKKDFVIDEVVEAIEGESYRRQYQKEIGLLSGKL